jgi:hypothetical protein
MMQILLGKRSFGIKPSKPSKLKTSFVLTRRPKVTAVVRASSPPLLAGKGLSVEPLTLFAQFIDLSMPAKRKSEGAPATTPKEKKPKATAATSTAKKRSRDESAEAQPKTPKSSKKAAKEVETPKSSKKVTKTPKKAASEELAETAPKSAAKSARKPRR